MTLNEWLARKGNTQERLASLIKLDDGEGVRQSAVSWWLRNGVPDGRVAQLVRVTNNEITFQDLRPDWEIPA